MHPDHHQARRAERAKNIHNNVKDLPETTYVDAAKYKGNDNMTIAVVDYKGNHKVSGSVRTSYVEEAEEAAIALAIASTSTSLIVSDSQTAVRNFARGRISQIALRILAGHKDQRTIDIVWAPAHSSLPGNEAAHQTARGLTDRASGLPWSSWEDDARFERMTTYRDITQYYRLSRKIYPPAHSSLNKGQAVAWRLLQTHTFPSPVTMNRCVPELHSDKCKFCNNRADLSHILWACPQAPMRGDFPDGRGWNTALLSSDSQLQARLIRQAEDAAKAHGIVAVV